MLLIDLDDDRNCYCGMEGEYENWNIDPNVLADAQPGPCEDAVSREAAIDVLKMDTTIIPYKKARQYVDLTIEEISERLKKLPSVQPEQRWIPVTERLPEDEYVLISKKPSKITGSKWSVDIAIRTADPRSGKIQWRDSGFGVIQDDKVLAWQPLPEPYREEGGE